MHDGLPFSKPKVRLLGSPGEAQAYLGEAYNLLYKVRAFCEASGAPVFAMSRNMPDGAVVTAAVIGDEHIVSCTPPAPRTVPERKLPESEGSVTVYMETGQIDVGQYQPAAENRFANGTWRFLGVGTSEPYLGRVKVSPKKLAGEQVNDPALADGQPSLAFGFEGNNGEAELAEDPDIEWKEKLLVKKQAGIFFAPSLFTGKLRKFMQAQYGARLKDDKSQPGYPSSRVSFFVDAESYGMTMNGVSCANLPTSTLGLFTNDEYEYWLLRVTTSAVYVCPIKLSSAGELLRRHLIGDDPVTGEEAEKIEAYMLADANFDASKFEQIGEFSMDYSATLSYGWKFSWSGKKASLVAVRPGTHLTKSCFFSQVHTLSITQAKTPEGKVVWYVSHSAGGESPWQDGWGGASGLWVPFAHRYNGGILALWSCYANQNNRFVFENVPIYCWYKGETLEYVKLTYFEEFIGEDEINPRVAHGVSSVGEQWSNTTQYRWTIDIGGLSVSAEHRYGQLIEQTWTMYQTPFNPTPGSGGNFNWEAFSPSSYSNYFGDIASIIPACAAARDSNYAYKLANGGVDDGLIGWEFARDVLQTISIDFEQTTGFSRKGKSVAIVIPTGDCEAACLAERDFTDGDRYFTKRVGDGTYSNRTVSVRDDPGKPWRIVGTFQTAYRPIGTPSPWFMSGSETSGYTPEKSGNVQVRYLGPYGMESVKDPGYGYGPLFNPSAEYPFYDRGLGVHASTGSRVVSTEKDHTPLVYNDIFVGWA